jgi:hypothetical protein
MESLQIRKNTLIQIRAAVENKIPPIHTQSFVVGERQATTLRVRKRSEFFIQSHCGVRLPAFSFLHTRSRHKRPIDEPKPLTNQRYSHNSPFSRYPQKRQTAGGDLKTQRPRQKASEYFAFACIFSTQMGNSQNKRTHSKLMVRIVIALSNSLFLCPARRLLFVLLSLHLSI